MSWLESIRSFGRDERFILVTIGLATASVVATIAASLVLFRDEVELPPTQAKPRYITQDTEDALEAETIEKLLDHPNYSVSDVATRILVDRVINSDETLKTLLYGITRPEYDERMQSLRALALLTGFEGLNSLHHPHTYSALVRSLELSLNDCKPPDLDDPHWDEYYVRDMAERFCLLFILDLVAKHGPNLLIKAHFVEKWLAKQDWGSTETEKKKRFGEYVNFKSNRIVEIVTLIKKSRRGLRALEKAGLIEGSVARRQMQELPDVVMQTEPESILESIESADAQTPRTREQSVEEQRLRRQHREAMVLNDGTRPLGRDDIFERDNASPG